MLCLRGLGQFLRGPERERVRVNKRQFDLAVGVAVGVYAAFTGLRLWAGKELLEGKSSGIKHTVAEVAKAVTG